MYRDAEGELEQVTCPSCRARYSIVERECPECGTANPEF